MSACKAGALRIFEWRLLISTANIKRGCKGFLETNGLAYLGLTTVSKKKSFITSTPGSTTSKPAKVLAGKSYWRGRLSTVDLLVLSSLDQLLFLWKYYLPFYKTSCPNEEVNCSEPFPSVSIPWYWSFRWSCSRYYKYFYARNLRS